MALTRPPAAALARRPTLAGAIINGLGIIGLGQTGRTAPCGSLKPSFDCSQSDFSLHLIRSLTGPGGSSVADI